MPIFDDASHDRHLPRPQSHVHMSETLSGSPSDRLPDSGAGQSSYRGVGPGGCLISPSAAQPSRSDALFPVTSLNRPAAPAAAPWRRRCLCRCLRHVCPVVACGAVGSRPSAVSPAGRSKAARPALGDAAGGHIRARRAGMRPGAAAGCTVAGSSQLTAPLGRDGRTADGAPAGWP